MNINKVISLIFIGSIEKFRLMYIDVKFLCYKFMANCLNLNQLSNKDFRDDTEGLFLMLEFIGGGDKLMYVL